MGEVECQNKYTYMKTKLYRNTRRWKEHKRQVLFRKVLMWFFLAVSVTIAGTWNHYTQEYKKLSTEMIESIKHPVKVERVKAAPVPEVTKTIETVEQMVDRVIKETNFKWPSYLKRLINCESRWNPNTTNVHGNNPSTSKDRGLLQINSHWHSEITDEQAYSPEWSVRWAIKMINDGKQGQWACDRIIRHVK